ncbi:hypothetical protein B0O80DRAFT_500105 [Mortierella sp. GBAus27b]|nr:hypothetical protein B0O80DRAFT_500105 [Mortierella sp. GBAus27b]
MGIVGLWQFLRHQGYEPRISTPANTDHGPNTVRVDVLASFYSAIRYAYTHLSQDTAHAFVERAIVGRGVPHTSVLYLDGSCPDEKINTQEKRAKLRSSAAFRAIAHLDELEQCIKNERRVRKRHFVKINRNINAAFYWSPNARASFASYMRAKNWTVRECSFEADVAIARDCMPQDVVISSDSDMLGYDTVATIWRPISKDRSLIYDIQDVLKQLQISRQQLTALCIVSRNDYNCNIPRLGPMTNYDIIRSIDEEDPKLIVGKYLSHHEVVRNNSSNEQFGPSIRVFVDRVQSSPRTSSSAQVHATSEAMVQQLSSLQELMRERKNVKMSTASTTSTIKPESQPRKNIYRTIDRPPEHWPRQHDSGKPFKYRKRYSYKTRSHQIKHPPPDTMKKYVWKPWQGNLDSPNPTSQQKKSSEKSEPKEPKKPKDVDRMDKQELSYAMEWEHPIRTLSIGTLNANLKRALSTSPDLRNTVKSCIQEVVRQASITKRTCQRGIALYIEHLSSSEIDEKDRVILDMLCTRVSDKVVTSTEDLGAAKGTQGEGDEGVDENKQSGFLFSLLIAIYNGRPPSLKGVGRHVCAFLEKAKDFLPAMASRGEIEQRRQYPGSSFLRSSATQLMVELSKVYKIGSRELCEKIQALKKNGILPADTLASIDRDLPAVENYIRLNKACGSPRRLAPMSSLENSFITLSELELVPIFYKHPILKAKLQEYAKSSFPETDAEHLSAQDIGIWLSGMEPGSLITRLITDIGTKKGQDKRRKGYKAFTMPLDAMKGHIRNIRSDDFEPGSYTERGYVLRGSIKTDGFLLQLLAYKMNELNAVKYRRLPENKLPPRITSTLGGTDYYLTEIRNIVSTKEDVAAIWGCRPEEVKILGVDLGQACVVGASALLPSRKKVNSENKQPKFINLSVKQKAVYQPTLKHRRWMEQRKAREIYDSQSISDIESSLPPLRGQGASIEQHINRLREVEAHLDSFYNGSHCIKKHKWNAGRARDEEFARIADCLLRMVGGSIGAKREESNKVVIAVGLGQFSSSSRLSSLHETFLSYFVQTARSLGYVVVGVNEYYTSKKCPTCQNFVGQVEIRRLYCSNCQKYMHRDVMAGHNICNVVQGHLLEQQRPLYLQPIDKNGFYPWMECRSRGQVNRQAPTELEDVDMKGPTEMEEPSGHKRECSTEMEEPRSRKRIHIE